MANKNSVNKPKIKIIGNKHAATIGKKRAARARKATPTRSSTSRYADNTAARPSESKSIAIYTGNLPKATGVVVNNSLSNKRAKKLARNQKYIDKRNEKLSIDVLAKEQEAMDIDEEAVAAVNEAAKSKLESIKGALWAVVEDRASEGFKMNTEGEGTTLGIRAF